MEFVLNSLKIGEGHVYHSRKEGAAQPFKYPSFFLFFQCSQEVEIQNVLKKRFPFLSLVARDYLQKSESSFSNAIKLFLKENCNYLAEEVWLHTLPRMFHYAFNPVSFWCCYRNEQLEAILVEVHNTFGERHFYWIRPQGGIKDSEWYRSEKVFHVSPFFPVDGYYKFRFQFLKEQSRVDINYYSPEDQLRLATWVSGNLREMSQATAAKLFFKYGWITPLVVFRIHYQAFKLWLNKHRFYTKPKLPAKEIT